MTCGEYLALHSELLDEQLDVENELRCRSHAEQCESCARYDRVMQRGLRLVRELPMVSPSAQFLHRFQHRVLNMPDHRADQRFAASGTLWALALAGVIATAAWSPLLQLPDPVDRAGSGAAPVAEDVSRERVMRRVAPAPGVPAWWYDGNARAARAVSLTGTRLVPTAASSFSGLAELPPGPYSPLIISPPLQRGAANGLRRPGQ